MYRIQTLIALLTVMALVGCGSPGRWLKGKWVVDLDYTQQQLKEHPPEKAGQDAGLGGMLQNLAHEMAAPLLIRTLSKAEITFTDTEIITTIEGNGKATGYEIVETPNADTVVIKKSDGEVQTFERVGQRMRTTLSGAVPVLVYLKRPSEKT